MENTPKLVPTMMIMMMSFIIIIIIMTVQDVGILMVDAASWDEVQALHEAKINAVSGEDDSEKKEGLVLEKFRALLGLSSLKTNIKSSKQAWENGSPAPAPSPSTVEAPGPAPFPVPASATARVHSHRHQPPRPRPMLPIQKLGNQHRESDSRKRIMIAAFVCIGVAVVICALGLIWFSRRLYKQQKGAAKKAFLCGDISSQNLASKVRHDPGFDLCYLNTYTTALEPQTCLKGTSVENMNCSSNERKYSGDEIRKCASRESNSFSAEEIISVHEYAESSKYESDGQNSQNGYDVGNDGNLSEYGSFHSLCDSSSSSNLRLSNVSLGSFHDPVEVFSPNQSNRSLSSPITDTSLFVNLPSNPPQCQLDRIQPTQPPSSPPYPPPPCPPPPPPPPPPFQGVAPSHPTCAIQPKQNPFHSLRNSDSPSGSNQRSGDDLPSPSTTPKTLETPSNIPTPPCPPTFLNKSGNSFNGPPPPPDQPSLFTPMGKDGAPLPKLKPLHWDKVRAAPDRSMVWDKLRCSSFELDEEMIESLFGYNLKTAFKNDEGKSKSPSPSKHVLEPKRLQNITILSKALNVTAEKVCEALVQGDGLCSQQLEALVKMAPTKEEGTKLSNYKGDINELGSAEKLVKEMLTIPHAFQRIEAMLYRATFDDEVVHLRNSFSMLEEACKELRSSRLFLKLLEAVLKTGNRMNVGTIRGGARAFKLDALLKLADVKGTDGKTTLLHFVVQEIVRAEGIRMSDSIMGQIDRSTKSRTVEEKEDDYRKMGLDLVSGLSTELCNVKRTASIDLDVLATSVSNLSDGLSKLQQLVNKDMFKDAPKDNFVHAMKTFLSHAEKNLKELQAEEDKVLLSVRQITEYYHGDVSKDEANPLRIFVIVRDFLGMLDQVCRELKSLKTPRTPNPLAPFK